VTSWFQSFVCKWVNLCRYTAATPPYTSTAPPRIIPSRIRTKLLGVSPAGLGPPPPGLELAHITKRMGTSRRPSLRPGRVVRWARRVTWRRRAAGAEGVTRGRRRERAAGGVVTVVGRRRGQSRRRRCRRRDRRPAAAARRLRPTTAMIPQRDQKAPPLPASGR
jgi:hypothetical protein